MSGADIAAVAKLIANPTSAGVLDALLSDRTLTISDLAREVGRSRTTVSGAVSTLAAADLVRRESVGRVTVVRLTGQDVAEVLERLGGLTRPSPPTGLRQANQMQALRRGRTCFDHLAGQIGIELTDRLLERRVLAGTEDGEWSLTSDGSRRLVELGIDPGLIERSGRRPLIRPCMDWTERRPHVAGRLGAAICTAWLRTGLVSRLPRSRAVKVTSAAEDWLSRL
jgi:DNA-binding transcriptional ArsR family regulator